MRTDHTIKIEIIKSFTNKKPKFDQYFLETAKN